MNQAELASDVKRKARTLIDSCVSMFSESGVISDEKASEINNAENPNEAIYMLVADVLDEAKVGAYAEAATGDIFDIPEVRAGRDR